MSHWAAGGELEAPSTDRGRLLKAFVSLVAAGGYDQVEPAAVSRAASLAEGSFELAFPTLFSAFTAAWDSLEGAYLQRLSAAYGHHDGWRDQLRAAIAETLRLVEDNPAPARFLTIETLAAGELERRRQRDLAIRLSDLLEAAGASTETGEPLPDGAGRWILAMVFDRIYRHVSTGTENRLSAQLPQLMFLAVSPCLGPEAGLAELRVPPPTP